MANFRIRRRCAKLNLIGRAIHNSRGCGSRLAGTGVSMNPLIFPAAALCLATCTPLLAAAPLPAERLSVAPLPPNNPPRVYVVDDAFENEIDARVHLFDGDTYQRLGQIDAGFNPAFNLSPDAKTSIVGTTYFSRGSRGVRTDVVEFTDNSNLKVTHEIVLPSKRAMTLPTYFGLGYSADARFVYVSYITPAASFGVLDPAKSTVLAEIDTAGCVLGIPSGPPSRKGHHRMTGIRSCPFSATCTK